MDDARFGKLWKSWDARISSGETVEAILREAKDEDLVEILGGETRGERKYARDVIATELLNRLHARTISQPASARAAADSARAANEVARDGQYAIHTAEEILKSSGQEELGASVSASAYASLDATEAAFQAADRHAETLEGNLAQSRIGTELAKDAVHAAKQGIKATHDLEHQMEELGKAKEGRAASEASQAIGRAAADASKLAESRTRPDADQEA